MLVSATEMLKKAKAGHYAVGQFNFNNLEWTKAILQTAQELNSPVILGVSEGAGKYMTGYKTVVGMVNGMLEELNITVPVALHLDHGSYDGCYKCLEAGFSSIMFDGSHYPIDENVEKTTELVKAAHEKGVSIEAEVGAIEARLIGKGIKGDWQKLLATPKGESFRVNLEAPTGAWYAVEVRALEQNLPFISASVAHVGVGEVFVIAGQSNSANHAEEKLSPKSDKVVAFDGKSWKSANDPQPGASGGGGSFSGGGASGDW